MIASPLSVPVDHSLDDLADFFERHNFLGVPVVDADGILVGVVKRHDVESAMTDRADND
jgi:magnesium transporter